VCEEPFSVIQEHVCKAKSEIKLFDPYQMIDIDYGELEVRR
jgi:hypothetical protein